jgi:hypothetical protein
MSISVELEEDEVETSVVVEGAGIGSCAECRSCGLMKPFP